MITQMKKMVTLLRLLYYRGFLNKHGVGCSEFQKASIGIREYSHFNQADSKWRRLVVNNGKVVGGVFINELEMAKLAAKVIARYAELGSLETKLKAGDWNVLSKLVEN